MNDTIVINDGYWRTADGQEIPLEKVTHEHWSNIYWYHLYIAQMEQERIAELQENFEKDFADKHSQKSIGLIRKCNYLANFALENLESRFNGELLDWIPKYENEKAWFEKQNTRKMLIEKHLTLRQLILSQVNNP